MKKKTIILTLILGLTIASTLLVIFIPKTCISTFEIDDRRTDKQNYGEKLANQDSIGCSPLEEGFDPIELDFKTRISEDEYLMGIRQETGKILVNSKYFSDLKKADATRVKSPVVIGKYKDLSFNDQSPREIVEFLLKSQFVTTYWHLGSSICLVSETNSDEKYTANLDASHDYCTDGCVTEDYSFSMEIDKNSGEIRLLPGIT